MIDLLACHLALRTRALTAVAATTGTATLSATTTGYARASGSFVTDGFSVGMEITPTGFTTNTVDVLTGVTALTLTTANARSAEASAGSRSIVCGVPAIRAYENISLTPTPGRPYIEEEFVPATMTLVAGPASGGFLEETGLYVVKIFGVSGVGVSAIRKYAEAIKALFTPGTNITAGSNVVRVRGDTSTQTGQLIPLTSGWTAITITIPWRSYSTNLVAA